MTLNQDLQDSKTKLRDEKSKMAAPFLTFSLWRFCLWVTMECEPVLFWQLMSSNNSSFVSFIELIQSDFFRSALLLVFTFRVQTDDNMDRWPIYECNWALVSLFLEQQVSSVERPCWLGRRKCLASFTTPFPGVWMRTTTRGAAGRKKVYSH